MVKNLLKKLGREEEPEELDTGYDSGYYGGQAQETRTPVTERPMPRGYEEPEYRSDRDYVASRSTDNEYRQPQRESGYYEEEPYASRADRSYTRTDVGRYAVAATPVNKGTLYFRPEFYSDKREEMVDGLSDSHVVMISTNYMDSADRMRLVDYLMGAVRALKGEMAYRNGILAMAPKGVEVDEADYELLEDEEIVSDEAVEWDEETDGEYEADADTEYEVPAYEEEN